MSTNAELTPGLKLFLKEAAHGQLATLMPDGSPQLTYVWLDTDGTHVLVNTIAHHQKARNVRRDPRVAINVHDAHATRLAHIRGRVIQVTSAGADEHIDELTRRYMGKDRYPWRRPDDQRIILTIQPESIYSVGVDSDAWVRPEARP